MTELKEVVKGIDRLMHHGHKDSHELALPLYQAQSPATPSLFLNVTWTLVRCSAVSPWHFDSYLNARYTIRRSKALVLQQILFFPLLELPFMLT
jgi:hypothetical protein